MALTADINRDFYTADIETYPVRASSIIYKGSAVGEDGAGNSRALVAGDKFQGFAEEGADNSAGAAGAIRVTVRRRGAVSIPVTAAALADNDGVAVYASDDTTFTKTATGNSFVGHVRRFESTGKAVVQYNAIPPETPFLASQIPAAASFTLGAEGSNARTVSIQLKDYLGNDLANRAAVHAYLSSDANGDVLEAASGTLSVAGGTDGVLIENSTDNGFLLVSEADGDIDVVITETVGANTFYLVLVLPTGQLVVSQAIDFA